MWPFPASNVPHAVSSREFTRRYATAAMADQYPSSAFLIFPNLEELLVGKSMLDLGTGDASFVRMLQSRGFDAEGIDLFEGPKQPYVFKGDFMAYPFARKYDVLFANGVFEEHAIYQSAVFQYSSEAQELRSQRLERSPPEAMLRRLDQLLNPEGFCLFKTYIFPFLFTRECTKQEGFVLTHYRRRVDTGKYPGDPHFNAVLSPENWYVLYRRK